MDGGYCFHPCLFDDFRSILFLCRSLEIPWNDLERLNNGTELYSRLEHRGYITKEDNSLLLELLFHIGRRDLVMKMGTHPAQMKFAMETKSHIKPYWYVARRLEWQFNTNIPSRYKCLLLTGGCTAYQLPKYPMDRVPRGFCIIINNREFSQARKLDPDIKDRTGTDVDRGWSILLDLQMRLFCCFVSEYRCVLGVDGKKVLLQSLTSTVAGHNCAGLIGKPKVFIIQACQGNEEQQRCIIPQPEDLDKDGPGDATAIPFEADILIALATVPGYYSFRSKRDGTWFIQTLCGMLNDPKYRYVVDYAFTSFRV
uniref:Caspase-8 n=1 Tax=Eptatretus burgeri TaxID=7764 RepID=A0A8C4R987_EPTBU